MAAQVALKRQQAAEDAIAMGLRACSPSGPFGMMPTGPMYPSAADIHGDADVTDRKETESPVTADDMEVTKENNVPPSGRLYPSC